MLFLLFSVYHSYDLPSRFSVASVLLVRVQTRHPIKTQFNKKKKQLHVSVVFKHVCTIVFTHTAVI